MDIDPVIIEIAKEEFDIDSYTHTEIICQDAYNFVAEDKDKYEVIIIDLWIDDRVPAQFFTRDFWKHII